MNPEPIRNPDDQDRPGILHRIIEKITGVEPIDDPSEAVVIDQDSRGRSSLRMHSTRVTHATVRRNVQVIDDARIAADGLKNGEQQIINLEHTTQPMGERIIDFLTGVCYALDGSVEQVGERVFAFFPATVQVDIDNPPAPAR